MKKILAVSALLAVAAAAFGQAAPTLSIDYQVNAVAADDANNYLTFKGPVASVAKDQFDATTGASMRESTVVFNYYRNDIFGKKVLPGGLRGLFLYPIAGDKTRTDDALNVAKLPDGSIRVRYIHRGTANEVTTDSSGKLVFPGASFKARKVGYITGEGPQVIASDFYVDDMAAKVDWDKVWNKDIKGGKTIGATTQKTGDITADVANSELVGYEGALQFTFDGKILKVAGDLKIVKK
ncbi:MAG TPA: hypothetical protein DIC34_10750 [Treponema sp.]|nr:MAG: hypothetical protein A2001_05470 [Treponema sp. GWC1_61_84]HCM27005.1 hypothetical protein [Treponema sp.]